MSISVTVLDSSAKPYKARAVKAAQWLMRELDKGEFSLEMFLVGDAQVPKNVLAFPATPDFPRPDLAKPPLGEIYLNPRYIAAHDEDFEYMLVHGFLHLLGYDHIKKSDRMLMEKREMELLKKLRAVRGV